MKKNTEPDLLNPAPEPVPEPDTMTIAGLTFTTKQGTFKIYEETMKAYGKDVTKPMCSAQVGGCSSVTSYIVIKDTPAERRRNWWAWLCAAPLIKFNGNIYFPMQICHKCGAMKDGYGCGLKSPELREIEIARYNTAALTAEEKKECVEIFARAYKKGRDKAIEKAGEQAKSTERYRMKGGR
jgi:hypothetical protein